MKKIYLFFTALLFIANAAFSQSFTASTVSATAGTVATVAITYNGSDYNLVGLQVDIVYNTNMVSWISTSTTHSSTGLTGKGSFTLSSNNNGLVRVLWDATDLSQAGTLSDGATVFEVNFIANQGGAAALTLANEIVDESYNAVNFTNNDGTLTFSAPAASTTWNGTASWYTPANWSNGLPGQNTDAIIASGVVTIDGDAAYTKSLTINAGAGVTLNSGSTRKLNVNGNFVLASSATSNRTGTFLNDNTTAGTFNVSGTISAQRWFEGGKSHMVSIPVTAASISNFYVNGNTGYFYNYDEPSMSWQNPYELTTQLDLAEGYLVDYASNQLITVSSTLNNDASYTPALSNSGNGWNLVGNPYPTSLDWTAASAWTKTNIDDALYIWNGTQYASYVASVGNNGGSQYIAPFQGFFVHASGAPSFSIKKAARTHNTVGYMKSEVSNVLHMVLSNGTYSDESVVYLNENATSSFDTEYDAYKLMSLKSDVPSLYSKSEGVEYSINALPFADNQVVALVMNAATAGQYTFTVSGIESFDGKYKFFLKDAENNSEIELNSQNNVTLDLAAGLNENRFSLNILKNGVGIIEQNAGNARVYALNHTLCFENCANALINVYDLAGNMVASAKAGNNNFGSISLNVASGVYMVKVITKNNVVASKVLVK